MKKKSALIVLIGAAVASVGFIAGYISRDQQDHDCQMRKIEKLRNDIDELSESISASTKKEPVKE